MRGSQWDEVLDELTKSLKGTLINISRHDIVKFCLENKTTRKAAEDFLKNYSKTSGKDSSYAKLKREQGNEKYKEKKFQDSLDLYTESIFHSTKGDESLPLAYSNRSLVLQVTGHPSESLVDIDLALENGYPKCKTHLLILRKAKCLVQLGDIEKAQEVLKEALKDSDKCGKFNQLMQQELEKIKSLKNKKNLTEEQKLPEVAGGENKNYVSASNYLSVNYDKTRGRHVIATEDIAVGDVLFVEKPFAFVLRKKGCHNCCKETQAPIPCWNCLHVSYCSPKCRDDFWKSVHSFECGFDGLFQTVGIAGLSLRIILKASSSLDELKKILNNVSEPEHENGIIPYTSKGYDSVYNLEHNFNKYETSDLFQYAMTALLLSLYLRKFTNYFPVVSDEVDLSLLTSVILRHILQLICNGHAITKILVNEKHKDATESRAEVRIGSAIYTSASMMNHSCESSINNSFHNNCLVVRAAKRIRKGEEVFNCYGPQARRMTRASRQEILSKQYFFKCNCQACIADIDAMEKFKAFKCKNCKGPSVPDKGKTQICLDCGQVVDTSADLENKCLKFYALLKEGERLLNEDVTSALKKFLECWWLGREIFYKFHKDLSLSADQVARCLADLEDFRRCMLFLRCSVRSVEERFGSSSIEFADEMKKLAGIVAVCAIRSEPNEARDLARQGLVYYEKAERILNQFCDLKELQEIRINKVILENLMKR